MKNIVAAFLLALISMTGFGQTNIDWGKFQWLMGNWVGEGTGKPGEGRGGFSLQEDLDSKILIRNNYAAYPAANGKPAYSHNDLMIIYPDAAGNSFTAIYFDNEGHNIKYDISYQGTKLVFLSEKTPGAPVFRLTYSPIDNQTVDILFEISQDGEKFVVYLDGKCKRAAK